MAFSTDLLNARIDLSDVLSWRASQTPRLIRLFPTRRAPGFDAAGRSNVLSATATEHFWLEGLDAPKTKSFTASSESGSTATFTVADASGWQSGDLFHVLGDHGVLRVSSASGTSIVGTRVTASEPGAMGGLYYFGTQSGGLARPQTGAPALTMGLLNRAAQDVLDAGGVPDAIICGAGQAQVISTFMESQVQVAQDSREAGRFVDSFVTSAGGATMKVVVEPSIPDSDVWVCDTRGFALVPLAGRALHTEPASAPGVDGRRAIVLGEYTAEFKNAKESLCRISGLKSSAEVLA